MTVAYSARSTVMGSTRAGFLVDGSVPSKDFSIDAYSLAGVDDHRIVHGQRGCGHGWLVWELAALSAHTPNTRLRLSADIGAGENGLEQVFG
jgi:hypothetical protein